MRTDKEILAQVLSVRPEDPLNFEWPEYLYRLPFDKAKTYLVADAKEEEWKQLERDRESILAEMLDYMPFAWEKANNCRGISAWRSLAHYKAWIWLLGDEEHFGNLEEYEYYGKDHLVAICEHYGWDHTQWDDGIRVNSG